MVRLQKKPRRKKRINNFSKATFAYAGVIDSVYRAKSEEKERKSQQMYAPILEERPDEPPNCARQCLLRALSLW